MEKLVEKVAALPGWAFALVLVFMSVLIGGLIGLGSVVS